MKTEFLEQPEKTPPQLEQPEKSPPRLGDEIQRLRRSYKLTLEELARKSGVSKAILSQIERDRSNPTLSTIWRITEALDHPIHDLLSPEKNSEPFEKIKKNHIPSVTSEDGGFILRILGLITVVDSIQWYEFEAKPGSSLISESHGTGSIECLALIKGKLQVELDDIKQMVEVGETLRYSTETRHKLTNIGNCTCKGFMVNLLSGVR